MNATENLVSLMNLGPLKIADVMRTTDGHYLGRMPGDPGFNVFIGRPNPNEGPGREWSRRIWQGLTEQERKAVEARCSHPADGESIPLTDFGIEVTR